MSPVGNATVHEGSLIYRGTDFVPAFANVYGSVGAGAPNDGCVAGTIQAGHDQSFVAAMSGVGVDGYGNVGYDSQCVPYISHSGTTQYPPTYFPQPPPNQNNVYHQNPLTTSVVQDSQQNISQLHPPVLSNVPCSSSQPRPTPSYPTSPSI